MFSRKIFLIISYLFFSSTIFAAKVRIEGLQTVSLSVTELNNQYERGVKFWETGDGRSAFLALDSLRKIELTGENAMIKSKGMIYLAKCFYSQKNFSYAINYSTLALDFGKDSLLVDQRASLYEMLITSFHETHNNVQELFYFQLKKSLNDSIEYLKMQLQVDSLKKELEVQRKIIPTENTDSSEDTASLFYKAFCSLTPQTIIYTLIGFFTFVIALFLAFKKNKNKPKNKTLSTTETPKIDTNENKNANALIEKIAKVELVFIRADVLGEYGNKKTVVKIINDYNTQLPLIIKNLDEAITSNDNEPIITALSYLKPYLTAFGMSATLAMLNEVETEAATEKTTRLLSRVFQIRNHIRRAHDETIALIEVLG